MKKTILLSDIKKKGKKITIGKWITPKQQEPNCWAKEYAAGIKYSESIESSQLTIKLIRTIRTIQKAAFQAGIDYQKTVNKRK